MRTFLYRRRQKPPFGAKLEQSVQGPLSRLVANVVSFWPANEGQGSYVADLAAVQVQNAASGVGVATINDPLVAKNVWGEGPFGVGLVFGNGKYMASLSSGNYDTHQGAFWFWFKTSQALGAIFLFGRASASNSNSGITVYIDSTVTSPLKMQVKGTSLTAAEVSGNTNVRDGRWHMALVNFDQTLGGVNELYLDGQLIGSAAASLAWAFNSQPLRWAKSLDGFWAIFGGNMDPGGWVNVRLSPAEIQRLYQYPYDFMQPPRWLTLYPPGFPPTVPSLLRHRSPLPRPREPAPVSSW